MARNADNATRIQQLDWVGLGSLYQAIERGDTPDWAPGKAFEHLVLRAFQLDGAEVRWPYSVELGDEVVEQIDGAIHWGGLSCLVESKDTEKSIPIGPLAKMRNQLLRRPAGTVGLVFSRSGFTDPALLLTRYLSPQTILLWNGGEIAHALAERKVCDYLIYKYRACVESGLPDVSILIEELE
jgi:hypothetical protein